MLPAVSKAVTLQLLFLVLFIGILWDIGKTINPHVLYKNRGNDSFIARLNSFISAKCFETEEQTYFHNVKYCGWKCAILKKTLFYKKEAQQLPKLLVTYFKVLRQMLMQ